MRVEFNVARGRAVQGRGSQLAAFSVLLDIESEQLSVMERAELAQRLTVRFAQAIAEEFGGEEIEIRRTRE